MALPVELWRRESDLSLQRSQARRAEISPHPFPRRGEWIALFLLAVTLIAIGWLILVSAWVAL